MSKEISKRLVLRDSHPTMVKLQKIWAMAEDLGITISFEGTQACVVSDRDRDEKLPELVMEDVESGEGIGSFPPQFEYKVVFENPAYLAEQKRLADERIKKQEEEERIRKEKSRLASEAAKAREAEKARQRAIELEKEERTLLKTLQAKYPNG